MIDKNHPSLSVGAQCSLLSISPLSLSFAPQGETPLNLWRAPNG
jgi:putative transposase